MRLRTRAPIWGYKPQMSLPEKNFLLKIWQPWPLWAGEPKCHSCHWLGRGDFECANRREVSELWAMDHRESGTLPLDDYLNFAPGLPVNGGRWRILVLLVFRSGGCGLSPGGGNFVIPPAVRELCGLEWGSDFWKRGTSSKSPSEGTWGPTRPHLAGGIVRGPPLLMGGPPGGGRCFLGLSPLFTLAKRHFFAVPRQGVNVATWAATVQLSGSRPGGHSTALPEMESFSIKLPFGGNGGRMSSVGRLSQSLPLRVDKLIFFRSSTCAIRMEKIVDVAAGVGDFCGKSLGWGRRRHGAGAVERSVLFAPTGFLVAFQKLLIISPAVTGLEPNSLELCPHSLAPFAEVLEFPGAGGGECRNF